MLDDQLTTPQNRVLSQATVEQKLEISRFLNQDYLTHRHLDWFTPLDWLGQQPYLIEKLNGKIQGIMLTAPEVKGSTWIRLFSSRNTLAYEEVWERLLSKSISILRDLSITQLAALGFNDWFTNLLVSSNFKQRNSIVTLEWKGDLPEKTTNEPQIHIRDMHPEDLQEIELIDRLAFSSLWQNSLRGLTRAYKQPGICTVATQHDQIVGYQISTAITIQSHLARLAVRPDHQGQHIASALVLDLLKQLVNIGVWRVTVNTQADNQPSLAVYQKFGFQRTMESIPVYLYQL